MNDILLPPHDIHAEQSILGALMISPSAYDKIEWLKEEAFFSSQHRAIYAAIRDLLEAGNDCDALLVCSRLEARGAIETAGGRGYVQELAFNVSSAVHARRYAELVRDKAILRKLQANAAEIRDRASQPGIEPQELAEEAEDKFLSVLDFKSSRGPQPFHKALEAAIEWQDEPSKATFVGYPNLDQLWGGLHGGDLIIIAGRPSMGKSSLASNIGEHVSQSAPVLFFSLEMTARALGKRSLGYHAERLGDRTLAYDHCSQFRLHVDETAAVGVGYVRAVAKRVKRQEKGLGLIIVDYLQLMTAHGTENRTQEIGAVSRGLKAIAKELDVPIIAVSQLNRGVEGRQDRRPQMSDLRESGQIEQDADIISFVYREEYYDPTTPMQGIAEVITRKHREGPVGTAYLEFVAPHARFENMMRPLPHIEPQTQKSSGQVKSVDFKRKSGGDE